jgi:DNA-binding LytR/AlgR family response regulator
MMNVFIVEDEPHARKELQRLLANSNYDIHVEGYADSIEDSVEWLQAHKPPELLFFDIQLSDGLSFEIFNQVEIDVPVIFCTAFDEYAIQAFKVNSVDYLLKPIKQQELNQALEKYKGLSGKNNPKDQVLNLQQIESLLEIHKPKFKTRFVAKFGDQIKRIDISEVAYFHAVDNEVFLITKNNSRYIIDYSLEQIMGLVDPQDFHRVNRSFVVHIDSIKKISKYFNSRLHLELQPQTTETVLISRVKVPEFMNWMDK